MAEKLIADFSGGMNGSVAVDKLADKECLLAENCRFDEMGNVLISGANSAQNGTPLTGGTSNKIHSLFFDQSLGIIAGVGTAVYKGARFGALSTSTVATNPTSSKMTFGLAPNRIYMDIGGTGYWSNPQPSDLVTIDWAPPSVAGATVTGPNIAGTGTATAPGSIAWDTASNITSTSSYASITSTDGADSNILRATGFGFAIGTSAVTGILVTLNILFRDLKYANPNYPPGPPTIQPSGTTTIFVTLLKNGTPVGNIKSKTYIWPSGQVATDITFGGSTDLWGTTFSQADINNSNFGFQISTDNEGVGIFDNKVRNGRITVYQGSGLAAGTGAAGTLTGTYTWKVTFVASGGEESDASNASNSVTLSTQQGTLTGVPTGDSRTATRNVYRKGNQLTAYYLVGSISDNITTTYADNFTDIAALTQAVILPGDTLGDEPNTRLGDQVVKYPCVHYDRVFWATGNKLIWSKPLNGFAYPVDFEIDIGDSKVITGLISLGGELIIFKPDSIWRMSGTDENSFIVSRTLSAVGTDWPFSIATVGGGATGFYFTGRILFANIQGIWAFNGYNSSKVSQKLDLWFRQDDRTGQAIQGTNGFHPPEVIDASITANFQGAASNRFYRLAYAEAGQTSNNAMIVMDIERGDITKRPLAIPSMAVDQVSGYFYAGSNSGIIVQLDDWNAIADGLGNPVNMDFQTKYTDLGLRGSRFAVWGIEFLIKTGGETVTPSIYFDEGTGTSESLGTISVTNPSRVFRKLNGASSRLCRNFSVRLNAQTSNANSSGKPNIQLNHLKIYYEERQGRARTGE